MHFQRRNLGHLWSAILIFISSSACAAPVLSPSLLWDNETVSTFGGGLRAGTTYDGMLLAALDARTDSLGAGSVGILHFSFLAVRSGQPSARYIGDFQSASNIEAPNATRLYSAWFRQTWAHVNTVQIGLIDLNTLFDVTDAAGLLLNASFGLDPTLSGNLPVSTYPEPGYGLVLGRQEGAFNLRAGLFQADPTLRTRLASNGALAIAELDFGYTTDAPTQLGLGLWRYRQPDPTLAPTDLSGGYINFSQTLTDGPVRRARAFLRLGFAPTNDSTVPQHLSFGVDIAAPLASRPDDRLALGVTRAALRGLDTETAYEATYQFALTPQLALQPDLQFIRNLSGSSHNASVFSLRLQLALD
ncbi:hypothetical protein BI364_03585 [Acidihalobacter yilgarnensis]|uniref:Uncharacterized protein n=1 Tax=Acidihalobacter yilgarnensis TaxID=2819280 RepID=A0A1D8IL61_9GAMM|nr:carbohydrate porin [Acidihalobacter yilgarnensis]AOU97204.1 hypothetical protein BI364_03585 [Acidihalobacter yilgarnensis]